MLVVRAQDRVSATANKKNHKTSTKGPRSPTSPTSPRSSALQPSPLGQELLSALADTHTGWLLPGALASLSLLFL